MKKFLSIALSIIIVIIGLYILSFLKVQISSFKFKGFEKIKQSEEITDALTLLRARKDKDALAIFEKVLLNQPYNLDALWGKAEVLRRDHEYRESQYLLKKVLKNNPKHAPSLISLAYIRYKDDRLNEAQKLIEKVLRGAPLNREDEALAYIMLGTINSRYAAKGGLISKIKYGTRIKGYFLKAEKIAPDLPEAHLGLGSFYLLAPAFAGGNLDKAIKELELCVKLSPVFATANARLAQAYKKKGDFKKFNSYFLRAKELEPKNEVLKELLM
jgi:tetratricopeptide (TPR) repeat protein